MPNIAVTCWGVHSLMEKTSEKTQIVVKLCIYCCLVSKSWSTLLWPHGLYPTRPLCPWYFPSNNTGVGCHFSFQEIFLTQGWNQGLLHWWESSLPLNHQGSPLKSLKWCYTTTYKVLWGRLPPTPPGKLLFCLENPMDKGTWQATVHEVAKSQTQLTGSLAHSLRWERISQVKRGERVSQAGGNSTCKSTEAWKIMLSPRHDEKPHPAEVWGACGEETVERQSSTDEK